LSLNGHVCLILTKFNRLESEREKERERERACALDFQMLSGGRTEKSGRSDEENSPKTVTSQWRGHAFCVFFE